MASSIKTPESIRVKHRLMYKCKTPPWRDAFRDKCFQRLRNSRNRLVDQFRGLENQPNCSVNINALILEEWQNIRQSPSNLPGLLQDAVDDEVFDDIEDDEVISFMDAIQKELMEEEQKILAQQYTDYEERILEAEVNWFEHDEVICPLCRKYPLNQNLAIFFCKCGLRIDTQQDSLTMDHVKKQLYQGLDSHDSNCNCSPTFTLISLTDVTNLAIICDRGSKWSVFHC